MVSRARPHPTVARQPLGFIRRRELPMAEHSSTVAAFRALVMLVCLILIPVAAFCGMSCPAVLKAIQSGRWPTLADFRGQQAPTSNQGSSQPRAPPRSPPPAAAGVAQVNDPKPVFSGQNGGLSVS